MKLRAADQHLVDFAPARQVAQCAQGRRASAGRRVGYPRAVVGDADEAQMREFERFEQLAGQRDRVRVGAIEGDPLLDLARARETGDEPVEDRPRDRQAEDDGEQEQQGNAARIMLDQPRLPDQRRGDEAADHRVERRVAVVAEVEQAAPIGLRDERISRKLPSIRMNAVMWTGRLEPRAANQRISRKRDRRADDEADDVGDEETANRRRWT